jgi:hypothetical protein
MSVVTKKLEPKEIELEGTGQVLLTIAFGYYQIGGSNVKFKDATSAIAKGKVTNLDLGDVNALRGKTLIVKSRILDSNLSTDKVSTTHSFTSAKDMPIEQQGVVPNSGDIMEYVFTYNFI